MPILYKLKGEKQNNINTSPPLQFWKVLRWTGLSINCAQRHGCHCLKQHIEILDKKKILQILVEENRNREKQHFDLCLQSMTNAKVILITLFTTYQSLK